MTYRSWTVATALVLLVCPTSTVSAQCCGDCNSDGAVGITDLVTGVGNALEGCPEGAGCCGDCDGDGTVAVNELVGSVRRALSGCDPTATPTPTDTPTFTATFTASSTPTVTSTPTPTATSTPTPTPIRAVDNSDGTVTDLRTGLMWEKKIGGDGVPDGSNPQDADNRYPWRGRCQNTALFCTDSSQCPDELRCFAGDQQGTRLTIFTWLDKLNAEAFAGYDDWRIPDLDELRSLRDLDEVPAIDPGLHADGCSTSCLDLADPICNCTGTGPYWTASEDPSDPAGRAWRIDFDDGAVVSSNKGDDLRVRAVRGTRR